MKSEHILFGKVVSVESKKDLCGFWRSFASIKIDNDYFVALSDEWLCDKESSIKESLSKLEKHFTDVAQGVIVSQVREQLTTEIVRHLARQQIALDLLNGTT